MDYSDPDQVERALQDPATPGEALAVIAQAHPALRDRVVTHPNAYPQLVTWVAAQSTSAAGASAPSQSGYGPAQQPYGPSRQPPYVPAVAQPYTPGQPYGGQAQTYPMQPSGLGGYQAGPPAEKKTGLVLGLVGGGVVAVAVVAVLGLFVFGWFGGSSGSGPTLTKSQVESFLDSEFMHGVSGGMDAGDFSHISYSADDFEDEDVSQSCQRIVNMMIDADRWSSWPSSTSVQRFPENTSPDSFIAAATACDEFDTSSSDLENVSVNEQDGGWWVTGDSDDTTLIYGNVWLNLYDVDDDEVENLFKDFAAAIDAAAR